MFHAGQFVLDEQGGVRAVVEASGTQHDGKQVVWLYDPQWWNGKGYGRNADGLTLYQAGR